MTHMYWGYDSQVLRIWLTGTEDMTHGYWGYDSQVMNILTGTAYSLYRVFKRVIYCIIYFNLRFYQTVVRSQGRAKRFTFQNLKAIWTYFARLLSQNKGTKKENSWMKLKTFQKCFFCYQWLRCYVGTKLFSSSVLPVPKKKLYQITASLTEFTFGMTSVWHRKNRRLQDPNPK